MQFATLSLLVSAVLAAPSNFDNTVEDCFDQSDYDSSSNPNMAGLHNAITNSKQVVDTLAGQIKSGDGHAVASSLNALITGTDSQIDNVLGMLTDSKLLTYASLGINKDIGNFLLGDFFQSVTNGVEVLIGNIGGGAIDLITDGGVKDLSEAIGKLSDMASKDYHVSDNKVNALTNANTQLMQLKH